MGGASGSRRSEGPTVEGPLSRVATSVKLARGLRYAHATGGEVGSRHGEISQDPRAAHRGFRGERLGEDGAGFLVLRLYAGGLILERSLGPCRRRYRPGHSTVPELPWHERPRDGAHAYPIRGHDI